MPDFDFIGFTQNKIDELIETITPTLKTLPFADDIVFIRHYHQESKVIQLKGGEAPFVRIYTRSNERAVLLIEKLKHFFDIEIIFIAYFTPQTTHD